jgi:carbonic anhydrase
MNTPWRMPLFVYAIIGVSIVSCSGEKVGSEVHDNEHAAHWGYEADNGPDAWGSMSSEWALCTEGREQSPIDLADTTELDLGRVEIDTPSGEEVEVLNQEGVIGALDNGHTIQINSKTGETMTIGDKTYALVQFHFHAPSEHTVDGEHYPMEMHLVHQAEDGALAVAGVFIQEGAENPGIVPLWAQLPEMPGTVVTVRVPAEFADSIFSGYSTGVYHYSGSLTTPPCSEGVNWYIRKTPTRFSRDQIAAFMAIYDHNNRPVQALNERTLYLDETPAVTIY